MKKTMLTILLLSAFSAPAMAAHEAIFVTAAQTRSDLILAAPPADDSATTKAELAELHAIEAARTPGQVARAQADDALETMFVYADVLGPGFDAAHLPLTAAFALRVKNDEGVNATPAKEAFQRVRPYNLDKSLHPVCKTKTKNDSYPSGHTTAGYLAALVLVEMVPEKRDAILARAADYAHNRLVCGVHYPSDVEASKLVAYATHAVMDGNPAFQAELKAATQELRQALKLAPLH
jgi:acid phosphatase (class A)